MLKFSYDDYMLRLKFEIYVDIVDYLGTIRENIQKSWTEVSQYLGGLKGNGPYFMLQQCMPQTTKSTMRWLRYHS